MGTGVDLDRTATLVSQPLASEILALEQMGAGFFQAGAGRQNHRGTVFGGRMVAQALAAALYSVDRLPLSSLHAYFLAAGTPDQSLMYEVTRLRDSRRFANRQIIARQKDRVIFTLLAEFHEPEEGFVHQHVAMPAVPAPEDLISVQRYVQLRKDEIDISAIRNFGDATPVELRPVSPDSFFLKRSDQPRIFWFRVPGAEAVENDRKQQCLLAYASDYWLGGAAAIPHVFPTNNRELMISSLDHALWYHRQVRCDDWLLYHTSSPSASDGLGLTQGRIFNRAGELVASVMQQCLMRRLVSGG